MEGGQAQPRSRILKWPLCPPSQKLSPSALSNSINMILSTASRRYQYSPLPKDTDLSFRLFTLYPANEFSACIRGNFDICSPPLSDPENCVYDQYEALSYTWGLPDCTEIILFPDKSHLPIASNLASFLRHRRHCEVSVILWVDAICINQEDIEERNSQVQAMGQIYAIASCLSIWLGPPSDDSTLAMSTLQEISQEHPYSKLSIPTEQSAAIEHLLTRDWWFRTWIIQEVALGGAGGKYVRMTVRCGFESITWSRFVLACSRMYVNRLNMRQSFPAVERVLKLDVLPSRFGNDMLRLDESYACRLLRQLSEHRDCLVTDKRDKIYALLGLWLDAFGMGKAIGEAQKAAPTVNYSHCKEKVYFNFATWIIRETKSLELLHHCQPSFVEAAVGNSSPTWVPDWSQALVQARLPCAEAKERGSIPWWSLVRHNVEKEPYIMYNMRDQTVLRKRAEEILRPLKSSLHYIPEWVVDSLDPDGSKGCEALLKELQGRPDVIFVFPDECDRALGDDEEDVWTAMERTQEHNEKHLQKQVLSQYIESSSLLRTPYRASGDTIRKMDFQGSEMHVEGILVDTVQEIFETFPEEIERDWKNSTLLMVQIGKCKQAVLSGDIEKTAYATEIDRVLAFWKTLFAGQKAHDETKVTSWLPLIPHDWQWKAPSLTVFESARLELAEIRVMTEAFTEHLASTTSEEGSLVHTSIDNDLAKDDITLDSRWTASDQHEHSRTFKALSKEWTKQPYDLYHRPFNLPYVVPDPFWESRKLHDTVALQATIDSRQQTIIQSFNAVSRELRSEGRRFLTGRIRQQPAREPSCTEDARLIKYALGRRFFVSKEGYFGLAPPNAQRGDRVAVFHGAETPFILRANGTGYMIVGESYVHGLMNGEALDQVRRGVKELQNIVLL